MANEQRHSIAVIIGGKGRGSNLAALAEACVTHQIPAKISVVISPADDLPALQIAKQYSLPISIVSPQEDRYGEQLVQTLERAKADIVCLAGYMRLLPTEVLNTYKGKILNIHPALLPKFGGKGMYGRHVHEAVLQKQERESGCTVHFVTENYDEGEIVLQLKCEVLPGDTPESLGSRVLSLEHKAYPQALKQLIDATRSNSGGKTHG